MVKTKELHCRISPKNKELLVQYVSLLRVRGKRLTESKVVDEALTKYGLEERCDEQHELMDEWLRKKKKMKE